MAIAVALGGAGALERLLDRAADDELAAEDAHRRGHRLAHHRLARAARRGGAARRADRAPRARRDQPPGQHQRPGRGVDEDRIRSGPRWLSQSASPILSRISRSTVSASGTRSSASARHMQRDALRRGQRVFVQKRVDAALAEALAAHRGDEMPRRLGDPVARLAGSSAAARISATTAASSARVCSRRRSRSGFGRWRLSKDIGRGRAGHLPSLRGPPIHTGKSRAPHATCISSSKPSRLARQDRMGPTAPMESTGPASLGFASPSPPRYHQHAETGHPETVRRGHIIRYYRV